MTNKEKIVKIIHNLEEINRLLKSLEDGFLLDPTDEFIIFVRSTSCERLIKKIMTGKHKSLEDEND